MKKTMIALLVIATIVPIVLLFWPFASWTGAMAVILRVIPSFSAQVLLFAVGKNKMIKILPATLTGLLAAWGSYLYFTSPHWSGATVGDLMADYVSPFISCLITLFVCLVVKNVSRKHEIDTNTGR